uniref:Uncharacterized protein n=1 Tax=Rhizophora mucronata TaxID=61149 RepID=A0A2P2KV57_RHIMU
MRMGIESNIVTSSPILFIGICFVFGPLFFRSTSRIVFYGAQFALTTYTTP